MSSLVPRVIRLEAASICVIYANQLTFRVPKGRSVSRLDTPASPLTAKIRYRSQAVEVKQIETLPGKEGSDELCTLHFASPVWGVTPGQSLVLYQDDLVVGGGIIV